MFGLSFIMACNGFVLGEVGDFYHPDNYRDSYEERMLVPAQNYYTKHCTANFF
jgi:hypothetical protein